MFLVLCIILFGIMAIAAFILWILDALSLLYPSTLSTSPPCPPSSSEQPNGGETVLDQQPLSFVETAFTCDSGLPSYEETMKSRWADAALDCHLDQNTGQWEPVGLDLLHNNSYFHNKFMVLSPLFLFQLPRIWHTAYFEACQGLVNRVHFCQTLHFL